MAMKNLLSTWKWSLGVVVRSPVTLLGLAIVAALWGLGAYRWLWVPLSSVVMLLLILAWGLAQLLVGVGILAGTAASAGEAAAGGAAVMDKRGFICFNRLWLARTALWALAAAVLVVLVSNIFAKEDDYALAIASFLTFRSETAISPVDIEKVLWTVETLLWAVVCGFLLSLLIILLRSGWRETIRQVRKTLARCCWGGGFLTTLLSLLFFGGLAYVLATWHPQVPPGFWDYTQAVLRLGIALLFIVSGWFFLLLSLARLNLPPAETGPLVSD